MEPAIVEQCPDVRGARGCRHRLCGASMTTEAQRFMQLIIMDGLPGQLAQEAAIAFDDADPP